MKFTTLQEVPIVSTTGDILKTLEYGKEVEMHEFHYEGDQSSRGKGHWAEAIGQGVIGAMQLYRGAENQFLEISQRTYECKSCIDFL